LLGAGQEIEQRRQEGGRGKVLVIRHRRGHQGGQVHLFTVRFLFPLVLVPRPLTAAVLFEIEEPCQYRHGYHRREGDLGAPGQPAHARVCF